MSTSGGNSKGAAAVLPPPPAPPAKKQEPVKKPADAPKKQEPAKKQEPVKKQQPIEVVDDTPFPVPELYFKVYESEMDEPRAKVRRDVNMLYKRWEHMHGRRWPDKGLDTEDLVWIQEEAYKPGALERVEAEAKGLAPPAEQTYIAPRSAGLVPLEKEVYEGEFISEPGDDEVAAVSVGPSTKQKKVKSSTRPLVSNYEATKAGARWVTYEFESEEYEAGNMELLWDMHLWDREGATLIMPDGPPAEAQGEESEDWDDFHTAYRPRGIDSDEAREAVWATDEFESDEDNTESEWAPEYVGAGLGLDAEDPINPQYSLRHSTHPLAPFPGEPLKWASYAYDDGTT